MHASIKYKILIITLLIIVGIVLYSNEVVYELVFKRFEFENGKWIGDNRAVYEFDQFYETFRFSFEYFVGMDDTGILRLNQGGSTYKQIIVVHGALFFIMYITAFLIVAKKYFNNQYILYIQYGIILIGTLYQRPMIANYAYVFLLYSSIFYISVNSNCPKIK